MCLDTDGKVYGFGDNTYGVLPGHSRKTIYTPVLLHSPFETVGMVLCHQYFSVFVTENRIATIGYVTCKDIPTPDFDTPYDNRPCGMNVPYTYTIKDVSDKCWMKPNTSIEEGVVNGKKICGVGKVKGNLSDKWKDHMYHCNRNMVTEFQFLDIQNFSAFVCYDECHQKRIMTIYLKGSGDEIGDSKHFRIFYDGHEEISQAEVDKSPKQRFIEKMERLRSDVGEKKTDVRKGESNKSVSVEEVC